MEFRNKINHILYVVIQLSWGIVQNIPGMILRCIIIMLRPEFNKGRYHGAFLTKWKFSFSMGLGMFIFYGHEGTDEAAEVLVHEYGHTIQSCILGPLFVPVIAIPSVVWAFTPAFVRTRKAGKYRYTDFYPEYWANKLGERILKEPSTWR